MAVVRGRVVTGVSDSVAVDEHVAFSITGLGHRAVQGIPVSIVVEVVTSNIHLIVEKVSRTIETCHPRTCDTVAATAEAAATAASHATHHVAGEVIETAVIGVVTVKDQTEIGVLIETAHKGSTLITGIVICAKGTGGLGKVSAGAERQPSDQAIHHTFFDTEVDHLLLIPILYAGKLSLLGLLADDLDLLDHLRRKVLSGDLRVIKEEGFTSDRYLGNSFSFRSDGTVVIDLNAREFLQEVDEHVILRRLERGGIVLYSVLLDNDRVTGRGHAGGIKSLLVLLHLDDAEIEGVLHLNIFSKLFIAKEFRLDRVLPVSHFLNRHFAVDGTKSILINLSGSRFGK